SRLRRALLQPLRCLPHGCVAAILLHLLQRFMDFMLLRMFLLVVEVDWLMGLLLLACTLVAAAWLMGLFLVEAEGLFLAEADMLFLVARILVECWLLAGIPVLRWLLGLLVCITHMEVLLGPLLDHIFLMEVKPWLDPCFRLGRRWLGCHMVMGFSRMVRRRCCSLLGRILPGEAGSSVAEPEHEAGVSSGSAEPRFEEAGISEVSAEEQAEVKDGAACAIFMAMIKD
ncbi:unnamed protein product, partial [Effrenium voratum]